ncbi:MAG: hypothetical protein ACJAZT_001433 [Gammaproteobacteria bacterium]|jgi:hypothetical protein
MACINKKASEPAFKKTLLDSHRHRTVGTTPTICLSTLAQLVNYN